MGPSIEGNFRKARLFERQEKGSLGRRQHKSEGGGGGKSKKRGKGFVVVSEQCRVGEKILELSEFRATLNRDAELSLQLSYGFSGRKNENVTICLNE